MSFKSFLVASVLLIASTAAHANQIFMLNGDTLAGGGTLTGSFTLNSALNSVVSYNIVASANGVYPGFTYNTADSSVTASTLPSQYFQIDAPGSVDELRLFFTSGVTASGGTINSGFSYEYESAGGSRSVSGAVIPAAAAATPEPSSLAFLGTGLLGAAGVMRRRSVGRSS